MNRGGVENGGNGRSPTLRLPTSDLLLKVKRVQFFGGLSPACWAPIVRLVAHGILALSMVLNLGVNINLNTSHSEEGLQMVKTTRTTKVAVIKDNKATGLGCVGRRACRSG